MRRSGVLLVLLAVNLAAIPRAAHGAPEELFRKIGELQDPSAPAREAALLPDGKVAYYWERTRPPTDQEKERRAAWFDAEWERFRRQAEQEGIPQIERGGEQMARQLEEEAAKQPWVVRPLVPILSATFRGLGPWLRWVMDYTLPIARQHIINQPVVVEAGLGLWEPGGKTPKELLPVDVPHLYGAESWARFPTDALHLRASPDGRYVALETADKAFVLFELTGTALSPKARVRGGSPLGWSPDGRLLFVTRSEDRKKVIAIYAADDLRELARCPADFGRNLIKAAGNVGGILMGVAISEDRLAMALFTDLGVCRLPAGSLGLPDPATLRRIGAPRGLAFSQGRLYVASTRGFAVVDPDTFAILDQYVQPAAAGYSFQQLAGVSPDGRYAAALHGKERDDGWATLFFWDVHQRRIVQRIGTQPGRMLDSISSGFRFIYPPAQLSRDWRYLLVIRQDGILELYQGTR